MKVKASSIRKSHIYALLVFILIGIIATIIKIDIELCMFNVIGLILIILELYICKRTMERISTAIKGSKFYDDHPFITRILKGMIFGCIFSIVILLPFHYLYSTHFDDIHDEFLVASSDSIGFEQSLYYFISWLVIGYGVPPEASEKTPAISYFIPTIIMWTIFGGIFGLCRYYLKREPPNTKSPTGKGRET